MTLTAGSWGQFPDDGLQADTGDVSELLLIGQHVRAQCIHYGLHLVLLHLTDEGPQARAETAK